MRVIIKQLKLFLFSFFILLSCNVFALVEVNMCTVGDIQYEPKDSCATSSRICCKGGSFNGILKPNTWSEWDKACPKVNDDYTYQCRVVPSSYCSGGGSVRHCMSTVTGEMPTDCTSKGEYCYGGGGGLVVEEGKSSTCYQCRCGMAPEPACNCAGSFGRRSCQVQTSMHTYMGTQECIGNCLWGECLYKSNIGEYCGGEEGMKYYCTPAAFPQNGGYQSCNYDYTERQSKIGPCNSCGENACLVSSNTMGGGNIKDNSLRCVTRGRVSGSNTLGSYTCVPSTCNIGYGWGSSGCTDMIYTSCNSGYVLKDGYCKREGGLKPVDPEMPKL